MRVTVLFLGPARDLAGCEQATLTLEPDTSLAQIRQRLVAEYKGLQRVMGSVRLAVNNEFAAEDHVLHEGDEIALIPPVSGGSASDRLYVDLVPGPIDVERVRTFVTGDPALGGLVWFEGVTRKDITADHGAVVRLEYEAYGRMAQQEMERLAQEAHRRWSAGPVAIVHRTGAVPPGEASVVIAVACPHRAEAFEACRWLIDTLKKDVPIWKKDVYEDGHESWVEPAASP